MRWTWCFFLLLASCSAAPPPPSEEVGSDPLPGFALIPAGSFEMGDHLGFVDPKHGGDETPIHTVRLDAFQMSVYDVTTAEYCEFLNAMLGQHGVEVRQGGVYLPGGSELLCETREMSSYSRIGWDGARFAVLDGKEAHPVICIRWPGAALYCNWLSTRHGLSTCYDTAAWNCDFHKRAFRLPTEAEWEYAARGGLQNPYRNFPWGDEADATRANWPESSNPFRVGPQPWTTPVGFFDGSLRKKADFGWPGEQETYQTSNGANGYGLYDMAGNVWQFVNDWYVRDYYAHSPAENPTGPDLGSPMPDGKPYRGTRGGNWCNGENGHSRVSNRNPSYWRGPQDPDHPYYHIGFRVVIPIDAGHSAADKQSPPPRDGRPPRDNRPSPPSAARDDGPRSSNGTFMLSSPEVTDGGTLPVEYTGDGSSSTLPLEWRGVPAGTKCFAVVMHHIAPDQVKWYWVLYNIPAETTSLPKDARGVGVLGNNSINGRTEYAPPHSKGPGPKTYIYTVYALSAPPVIDVPVDKVNRDALLAAIKDRTLASAELHVVYSRSGDADRSGPPADRPQRPGERPARPDEARPRENGPPPDTKASPDASQPARAQMGKEQSDILDSLGYFAADSGQTPAGQASGGQRSGPHENKTPTSPNAGQTVGLFLNTPKAFVGYNLFAPKHNTITFLMDNEGRIVHQWKSAYEPGQTVYLKPNGHLLHCCFTHNRGFTNGGEGGRIEEFDWDGNMVWEFEYSNDEHLSHHDIAPLPNGNILMLVVEKKTYEECLAAGFAPSMLRDRQLYPDTVVEVQPIYPKGGNVVWQWRVWDHLIQDREPGKANYGVVAEHPELVDVNCNGRPVPAFWNHMNSIAYNASLDQIMLSVRGSNEIWLLDHSTSMREASGHSGGKQGKGGDLIYRWGNPAAYGRGTERDKQLVQQHDAQWIPDGYPGAGHITIFNNGYDRGYSSIEEIVPPLSSVGVYTLESGKAYGPDRSVWHYEAKNRSEFFSSELSGAHRLPNGNTLVCAGVLGHMFEIAPSGEMVWQYVNPMVRGGVLAQGELPGKDLRGHLWNAVFKVHRYAPDYPGLAGRDLTPKGVIELPASEKGKTGLDQVNEQPREGQGPGGNRPPRDDRQPPPRQGQVSEQPREGQGPGGNQPPREDRQLAPRQERRERPRQ